MVLNYGFTKEQFKYWSLILSTSWLAAMCLRGRYCYTCFTQTLWGMHTRLFSKPYSIGMYRVPICYLAGQWLHPAILAYTYSLAVLLTWLIKQRIGIPRYGHSVMGMAYTAEEYPIQLVHIDKCLCTGSLNCALYGFICYCSYIHSIYMVYTWYRHYGN